MLKKSGEASKKVALLNPGTTGRKHFFEESCPKLPVSTLFSLCKGILSELGSRESSAEGNETRAWSNLMTGREASSQETELRPSSYNSRLSLKKGPSRTLLRQRCLVNEHCDLFARHTDGTETATTTRLVGFLLSTKRGRKRRRYSRS